MTKKEAVMWLTNMKDDIGHKEHESLWHYEQAIDKIIDLIDGLAKTQWIPVTSGQPEDRRFVLVTYEYCYGFSDIGISWYSESNNKWDISDWASSRRVLAWQSLPEPFKGECK